MIAALLIALVALAVGYAAFATTYTGTAEQFAALTGTIEKSLTATMEYVQYTSSGS